MFHPICVCGPSVGSQSMSLAPGAVEASVLCGNCGRSLMASRFVE